MIKPNFKVLSTFSIFLPRKFHTLTKQTPSICNFIVSLTDFRFTFQLSYNQNTKFGRQPICVYFSSTHIGFELQAGGRNAVGAWTRQTVPLEKGCFNKPRRHNVHWSICPKSVCVHLGEPTASFFPAKLLHFRVLFLSLCLPDVQPAATFPQRPLISTRSFADTWFFEHQLTFTFDIRCRSVWTPPKLPMFLDSLA
jgi:hypothetical protein